VQTVVERSADLDESQLAALREITEEARNG